jgi:Chaperone of endosialidase
VTPGAAPSNTATNAPASNQQGGGGGAAQGGKIGQIQHGNGNATTTNVMTPQGKGVQTTNAKTGVTRTVVSASSGKTVTTTNANTGVTKTIMGNKDGKVVETTNAKTGVTTLKERTTDGGSLNATTVKDPKTGNIISSTQKSKSIDAKTRVITKSKATLTQGQSPNLLNEKTRTTKIDPKTGTVTVTRQTGTANTATGAETVNSSSTTTRQVKTTSGGKIGRTQTANTNAAGGKGNHKSWQHNGSHASRSNGNSSQANNAGAWKNKSGDAAQSNRQSGGQSNKSSHNRWSHHGNHSNTAAQSGGSHNGSHHWQHRNGGHSHVQFSGGGGGGSQWQSIGGAALGSILSDIRLKRDIVLLTRLDNGIGLYRFRYDWSDRLYVGVMAQEVEAIRPDAVVRGADGYLRVAYGRLGLRFMTWDEWKKLAAYCHSAGECRHSAHREPAGLDRAAMAE